MTLQQSLFPLVVCVAAVASCGYHVSGGADMLPKRIHTIAIPAFGNATNNYKLSERITGALTREFISRTRTVSSPTLTRPKPSSPEP